MPRLTATLGASVVVAALVVGSGAAQATAATGIATGTTPTGNAATMVPATDRAVTFQVDGTTTYGTVHVPRHPRGARMAAALLLPGSGPTDRDGNQPPSFTPHTLALIADLLGDDGIMTLRYDKYFAGQTGAGAYAEDPGAIDLAAFVRQAEAAYATLRAQPEADPGSLLVVGHSEGGMIALLLGRSVHPRPAGLALLEPQDLRLLDLLTLQIDEQLAAAVRAGELSASQAKDIAAAVRRVVRDFRAGRPLDTTGLPPSLAALFEGAFGPVNARFVRTDDAVYPPAVARHVRRGTRVLVTCGTRDTNVPCPTTGPLTWALARAHVSGPGLRVLPGLDHLFHPPGASVNDPILASAARRALHAFDRPFAGEGRG